MTDKEIELAMKGLFRGASKVRARKYAKKFSSHINRELTARIAVQICQEEKDYLKTALLKHQN
tara:strand:- start:521 stop:709 length:189 start_codon:yes stop_codon:yes gene_type:complete